MADSLSGYMSEFEVYSGKKANAVEKNLGSNVVKTLTQHYVNTFRHVYFNDFFTGVGLLLGLL